MKKLQTPINFIIVIIITLGLSISLQSLLAGWSTPTQDAPGGAYPMAVNIGTSTDSMQSIMGSVAVGSSLAVLGVTSFLDNVGIGTTTPVASLTVIQKTGIEGVRIITSNYSPLVIRNSTDSADFLRVNQNGNVGIGISNPQTALTVRSSGSNWYDGGIALEDSMTNRYYLFHDDAHNFRIGFNGVDYFTIKNGGNVGIGTVNPGASLDVVGNVFVSGTIKSGNTSMGCIGMGGAAYASSGWTDAGCLTTANYACNYVSSCVTSAHARSGTLCRWSCK